MRETRDMQTVINELQAILRDHVAKAPAWFHNEACPHCGAKIENIVEAHAHTEECPSVKDFLAKRDWHKRISNIIKDHDENP